MLSNNGDIQDLKTFKVTFLSQDITAFIADLKIYQDIFSPYVFATIISADTMNFMERVKVGALFNFRIETRQGFATDGRVEFALEVYDIQARTSTTDKVQGWTIQLANREFRRDLTSRITQSFENKRPDEIANECLSKVGGRIVKTEKKKPSNRITLLGANKSPLIVANMALRNTSPSPDYFLFPFKLEQSGSVGYKLVSFDQKLEDDPESYDDKPLTFRQGLYNTNQKNIARNQNYQIRSFYIKETNHLINTLSGYNGSTLRTFDIMGRAFGGKGNSKAVMDFQPISAGQFDSGQAMSETSGKWYAARKRAFYKAMQYPVMFSTFGFVKSFNFIGELAYIELNEHSSEYERLSSNLRFKDVKFVIASVTHHINEQRNYRNSWKLISWEI